MNKLDQFAGYLWVIIYNGAMFVFIRLGWIMPFIICNTLMTLLYTYIILSYNQKIIDTIEEIKNK